MTRRILKQSHGDFRQRIRRLDHGGQTAVEAPRHCLRSALMGFGWLYLLTAIATNRPKIAAALEAAALPAPYHAWVFAGLAALLAASVVRLAVHLLCVMLRTGSRRANSAGLLLGGTAALALFHTPEELWTHGVGMLDGHSQKLLHHAGALIEDSLPPMDLEHIATVSSGLR